MLVEAYIVPRLGSTPLQSLTPAKLNAFYADLLESGAVKTGGKLSARTVRYTHTILRKALSEAVRWSLLTRNIADQADPPRERSGSRTQMRVWSAIELRAFLDHVADDRLSAAYFLAATTGMRRGEVLGLRWRDLDLDAGRLGISQTLITVDYEMRFSTPKTDRGRRSVALDPMTVTALRAHRTRQLEERLAASCYQDIDLVFAREDGAPFHPDRFSDLFDQYVRKAGLPRIRLHDLRHTHATLALSAGVHPKVVSERLGHSSVSITLDVYSHAIPAMQEDAAAKVAALVFAG
jgi:integrase